MNNYEAMSILDLTPSFTSEQLVKQYRKMSSKFHPDRGGTTEMMSRINQARDTLKNAQFNAYDDYELYMGLNDCENVATWQAAYDQCGSSWKDLFKSKLDSAIKNEKANNKRVELGVWFVNIKPMTKYNLEEMKAIIDKMNEYASCFFNGEEKRKIQGKRFQWEREYEVRKFMHDMQNITSIEGFVKMKQRRSYGTSKMFNEIFGKGEYKRLTDIYNSMVSKIKSKYNHQ